MKCKSKMENGCRAKDVGDQAKKNPGTQIWL
jgi:hypothetical protein